MSKRQLVESLLTAQKVINEVNTEKNEDVGYVTFITNLGFITGKKNKIHKLDSESEESFRSSVVKAFDEKKEVSVYNISQALYEMTLKELEIRDKDDYILIEDVKITRFNEHGNEHNIFLPSMILFLNDIIGLLPSKMITN